MKIQEIIVKYTKIIAENVPKKQGSDQVFTWNVAARDVRNLLGFILKMSDTEIFLNQNQILNEEDFEIFEQDFLRLLKGEPISYILGYKPFFENNFILNNSVLIPRNDSEILVENVIQDIKHNNKYNNKQIKIFEFGVGSGCLILSIVKHLNNRNIDIFGVGIDNSIAALEVANQNKCNLQINNVMFFEHDWNEPINFDKLDIIHNNQKISQLWLEKTFDIIIANPPYIAQDENLDKSVVNYEPHAALFAKKDGMQDYLTILSHQNLMKNNSLIYFELGFKTLPKLLAELQNFPNFQVKKVIKDLNGIDRVIKLQYCK